MSQDRLKKLFLYWAETMADKREYLIDLDGVAGDGDLGIVMCDGFTAVSDAAGKSDETDLGILFYTAGKNLSKTAPSSMGTLIALGFMNAGKKLKGKTEFNNECIVEFLEGLAEGVMAAGKAQEGEKTFLDAAFPAARAARENVSAETSKLTEEAANAAEKGFHDTVGMVAKHGRIAFRAENSVGIEDPGAAVAMLLVQGIDKVYGKRK